MARSMEPNRPSDVSPLLDYLDIDDPIVQEPSPKDTVIAGSVADWDAWGTFDPAEKSRLDRIHATLAAGYAGVNDTRVLFNLQKAAVLNLKYMQALDANDEKKAKSLNDQLKTVFEMEGMKAGDARPIEQMRVGGMAQRLEQRGMMKDGVLLLDGVVNYIKNDYGKYNMSKDAVDSMMLHIINAMRSNNGLGEITELTGDMLIEDKYGELLDNRTPSEREAMMEFGDVPNPIRLAMRGNGA